MIRPLGPEPAARAASTPAVSASFLARGDTGAPETTAAAGAAAGAGAAWAAGASWAAGAAGAAPSGRRAEQSSPLAPMAHTFTRQGTSSPSWKNISSNSPSAVDSHSKDALSVS